MAAYPCSDELKREIDSLVAENEELKQLLQLLQENQELKSILHIQYNESSLLPASNGQGRPGGGRLGAEAGPQPQDWLPGWPDAECAAGPGAGLSLGGSQVPPMASKARADPGAHEPKHIGLWGDQGPDGGAQQGLPGRLIWGLKLTSEQEAN